MKKGFTLIELLVVVLIIGILSAIALPQYQGVVAKVRMATYLPLMKNILEAEEIYYLNNGSYIGDVSVLDIDMSEECEHIDYNGYDPTALVSGEMFTCGDYFILDNAALDNRVSLNYCPGKNTDWYECAPNREFQISFMGPNNSAMPNQKKCVVLGESALGKRVCGSFGENGQF